MLNNAGNSGRSNQNLLNYQMDDIELNTTTSLPLVKLTSNSNSELNSLSKSASTAATTSASVDSLLMANYSPPLANTFSHSSNQPPHSMHTNTQLNYQQQHQSSLTHQQSIRYKKIRPEPVNERSIVDSVVGFFQDVVGSDSHHAANKRHLTSSNSAINNNSMLPSNGASANLAINEIKEPIEWIHFENFATLNSSQRDRDQTSFMPNGSSILLVIGYKSGFAIWVLDLNGVATEALSIKEPNITHVRLVKIESTSRVLVAIVKSQVIDDSLPPGQGLPGEQHTDTSPQVQQKFELINLVTGECLKDFVINGEVLEIKSNGHLICINSWNRIDAFDLNTYEHVIQINSCYSQASKSSNLLTNPFALGDRWLAFADCKYHNLLSSQGGVSTEVEQSYTATVLNTAKSISKGLVKISESMVNSVVSKSKSSSAHGSGSSHGSGHSPRLSHTGPNGKMRNDSKDDYQSGICTIFDTKAFVKKSKSPQGLYDENQAWIVAHFFAHQEPIYALEFNSSGRLLCTADCLGQYFNVFQINSNAFKSTRTLVKHLYSLYRGDTSAKVRNISFSNDSRWLAISTKRGTTHVFPINCYGAAVNARTHSKPYVVNRSSKHQRTAGFIDTDDLSFIGALNLNSGISQDTLQQQMFQQQYYDSPYTNPLVLSNNPKLKSLLEPLVIPAYAQLKQPNANSSFQSSIISSNSSHAINNPPVAIQSQQASPSTNNSNNNSQNSPSMSTSPTSSSSGIANASTLAASALSSAAAVTENVTTFGFKNFSLLATNTSNMIQYDNVCAVTVFAESRGYLTPEEPRDFAINRHKAAPSLFAISDVNGNLVEYSLEVIIDTSKAPGQKATNDSPILLKIVPKAQWPLQRFLASEELPYPIQMDNPLIYSSMRSIASTTNGLALSRKQSDSPAMTAGTNSPNSLYSNSPTSSMNMGGGSILSYNNDWIKQIEVHTHMGPHRRLFMGPQFTFKTFNSNLSTTMLNASSSSVMSDAPETPIIDLSGDIELNSLDLTAATAIEFNRRRNRIGSASLVSSTSPMQITHRHSKQKFDATPTYIEVGAGSYQEGMPICQYASGGCISSGSQKSLNSGNSGSYNSNNSSTSNNNSNTTLTHYASSTHGNELDLVGDNLIESLAEAMNEPPLTSTNQHALPINNSNSIHHLPLLTPVQSLSISNNNASKHSNHRHHMHSSSKNSTLLQPAQSVSAKQLTPAIAIKPNQPTLMTANDQANGSFSVGSYLLINPNANPVSASSSSNDANPATIKKQISCTSSSASTSSNDEFSSSAASSSSDVTSALAIAGGNFGDFRQPLSKHDHLSEYIGDDSLHRSHLIQFNRSESVKSNVSNANDHFDHDLLG